MTAAAKKGPAAQIVVADQYAKALQPVAEEFRDTAARYVEQALAVSQNIIPISDHINQRSDDEPLEDDTKQFLAQMF